MTMSLILFYLLAATAIGSALLIVSLKNLVRSIFLFFVTLFSLAGLYVFALADFIAITQVIVYVGGVLVLMLFAFMLSNRVLLNDVKQGFKGMFALPKWQGLLISLAILFLLLFIATSFSEQEPQWIMRARAGQTLILPSDNTIHHLGINLMTRYILPFEVISVFLMMTLIGAAHLARKEEQKV